MQIVELPRLSFETGSSSIFTILTTFFQKKNENISVQILQTVQFFRFLGKVLPTLRFQSLGRSHMKCLTILQVYIDLSQHHFNPSHDRFIPKNVSFHEFHSRNILYRTVFHLVAVMGSLLISLIVVDNIILLFFSLSYIPQLYTFIIGKPCSSITTFLICKFFQCL